ncbi:histone acetyltransferase [Aureococcus anophagefferens]|nr:histone acetyltransferase [Aureococcus anophagefferens]
MRPLCARMLCGCYAAAMLVYAVAGVCLVVGPLCRSRGAHAAPTLAPGERRPLAAPAVEAPARPPADAAQGQPQEEGGGVGVGAAGRGEEGGEEEKEEDRPDEHPFKVGSWLVVTWQPDASERLCTIIERAKVEDAERITPNTIKASKADLDARDDGLWRYYVHYADFNRRMDEWVKPERVALKPSAAGALAKAEEGPAAPRRRPRRRARGDGGGGGARRRATPRATHDEHEGLDEASLREHEEVTKVKNVGVVELGRHAIETWYFSPYPKEFYPGGYVDALYVCEHTFAFYRSRRELRRASARLGARRPPGDEIYRSGEVAMFEVDGATRRADHGEYCQNLCYFAKLFLDHKTLYYDVDPFLFYVLCELDDRGYHPVGFYSKEKYRSVKEKKVGARSPCRTWATSRTGATGRDAPGALSKLPADAPQISVMELSKATSIMADDVAATLQYLGVVRTVGGVPVVWCPPDVLKALIAKHPEKPPFVHVDDLHWTPFYTDVKKDNPSASPGPSAATATASQSSIFAPSARDRRATPSRAKARSPRRLEPRAELARAPPHLRRRLRRVALRLAGVHGGAAPAPSRRSASHRTSSTKSRSDAAAWSPRASRATASAAGDADDDARFRAENRGVPSPSVRHIL